MKFLLHLILQLTLHPIKTKGMLIRKSPFIGPLPTLYFGSGMIHVGSCVINLPEYEA